MSTDEIEASGEEDVVIVPEGASLETIRLGLLFTQRDVRRVERKVDLNGRMDEDDRAALTSVDSKLSVAISSIERLEETSGKTGWFNQITGQGAAIDSAKNPGLRLFILVFAVAIALGSVGSGVWWAWYISDSQQAIRDRREQQAFDLQKLALQAQLNQVEIESNAERIEGVAAEVDSLAGFDSTLSPTEDGR